jgi:hypothetical protein
MCVRICELSSPTQLNVVFGNVFVLFQDSFWVKKFKHPESRAICGS